MPANPVLHVVKPETKTTPKRDMVTRWGGDAAIFSDKWVAVPVQFLTYFAHMKPYCLTLAQAMFVIQLMTHKWDERAPFPGYRKIAARMGVSLTYARKLARQLEAKGFLRRIARTGDTNAFDLQPLFQKIVAYAKAEVARAKQPRARRARTG